MTVRAVDDRAVAVAREQVDDVRLHAVGVLKLVDEDVVELLARAAQHGRIGEHALRPQQEIVEVDDAALALFFFEKRGEAARQREQRNGRAMRRKLVVNRMALLVRGAQNAQRLLVLLVHLSARQIGRADLVRDRPQVVEPRLDRASARRRTMLAEVIANAVERNRIRAVSRWRSAARAR